MKRNDLEVGKWYYNPMMESHGIHKLRYTKISHIDRQAFPSCNIIFYDEAISTEGEHMKFKEKELVRQSNDTYESEMVKMDEREVLHYVKNKKFGL